MLVQLMAEIKVSKHVASLLFFTPLILNNYLHTSPLRIRKSGGPMNWELHRAMTTIGAGGKAIGIRSYFCFLLIGIVLLSNH